MMETLSPPNRRRASRIPVELDGSLFVSHRSYPCRIRNFCSGGLLLECAEFPANSSELSARVDIRFPSQDGQQARKLAFDIQIRHHEQPFLGVAFVSPSQESIQQLYRLAQSPVLSSASAQPALLGELSRFKEVFFSQLKAALADTFLQVAKDIQEAEAEAEGGNGGRSGLLFRLYRTLEKTAEPLAEVTYNQVHKSFQEFLRTYSSRKQARSHGASELSLVEETDFEDWLVGNVATRTIESELGLTQEKLNRFWGWILGYGVRLEENPAGVGRIVQLLQARLKHLGLAHVELRTLYRYLSPVLADRLKDVYEAALEHYQLEPVPNKEQEAAERDVPRTASTEADSERHADSSSAHQTDIKSPLAEQGSADQRRVNGLQTIRSLRRIKCSVSGEEELLQTDASPLAEALMSQDAADRLEAYSSNDLKQVVGALTNQFLKQTDDRLAPEMAKNLKQQILQSLGNASGGPQRPLPEAEAETIDVVEQLFGIMAGNPVLAGTLKRWLAQLKYLVLQIVLHEPEFFASNDHPLRSLINRLGLLGAGRLPSSQLEPLLQSLFRSALEPEGWNEALKGLLNQSEELLKKQENIFCRYGERIAKAAAGQQKLQQARYRVQSDLEQRLAGRDVAQPVLDLLYLLGWRQHLVVCLLKQEEKYREALGILDLLLSQPLKPGLSGQPPQENAGLLSMLEAELASQNQYATREQQWLSQIKEWLIQGQEPERVSVTESVFLELEGPFRIDADPASPELAYKERWEGSQLQALESGDWLWLKKEDGVVYLRVAWVDDQGIRCNYVSSHGIQESVLTWTELHQQESAGSLRLIMEQEPALVDYALYQMVHSAYSEVLEKVSRDPLTLCLTRHEFERQLERYLASRRWDQGSHLMLQVDIDKFRIVNNGLGIQAGDSLLKELARLLRLYGGEGAVLGRLGGNEFGLLIPDCGDASREEITERIRAGVEKYQFSYEDHVIRVTVSIGVTLVSDQPVLVPELIKRAGLACMMAKEQGGNRVLAYQPDSREQARQREMMSWLARLDEPLDQLFQLRCQPIVRIDGVPRPGLHYEVLLGVRGPENTLNSPVPLIEAAERFNRMARIDRWVIETVFQWMREHPQKVEELGGLSINLSGCSLSDTTFLEDLLNLLKDNQTLNPKVRFEITETAAVVNLERLASFARAAKRYGCSMSLDDFGTGLSSYAYLQQIPVDFLKIDGVFIRNLANSVRDQALVKSIAELARFLGIQTIAEFVEDEPSLEILKQLGVNKAQGYYVGKPILMSQL